MPACVVAASKAQLIEHFGGRWSDAADATFNALKDAQTNYYGAVYDALISKIDLEKAKGTLVK